jgi:hypothetical protein
VFCDAGDLFTIDVQDPIDLVRSMAFEPELSLPIWPSAHEAVRNGTILIAGCKGVVLHPVDSGDADFRKQHKDAAHGEYRLGCSIAQRNVLA